MLKGKDLYKVSINELMNQNQLTSLMMLYQPIIGHKAVILYLTLIQDVRHARGFESFNRLINILQMSVEEIDQARMRLEEYQLLTTFRKTSDLKDSYILIIHAPKSCDVFFKNDVFSRLLMKYLDSKQYEITLNRLIKPTLDVAEYKNITKKFNVDSIRWNEENEQEFKAIKPNYKFNEDIQVHINFDYHKFLFNLSSLNFPIAERSAENLRLIGEIATIYGISPDQMRILVGKCSSIETGRFDVDRFKKLAQAYIPKEVVKESNIYKLPCVSFLQSKQNGIEVTSQDKQLLEDLVLKMKLKPEVVNVLVEYILNTNDQRLIRKYVEQIAITWGRKGIEDYQQALDEVKNYQEQQITTSKKMKKKMKAPNYTKPEEVENEEHLQDIIQWLDKEVK